MAHSHGPRIVGVDVRKTAVGDQRAQLRLRCHAPIGAAAPKETPRIPICSGVYPGRPELVHGPQHILAFLDAEGEPALAAHAMPTQIKHQHIEPCRMECVGQGPSAWPAMVAVRLASRPCTITTTG